MKRIFTLLATALLLANTPVMAQMPAALLDNAAVTGTPEQWKAARPALLAALECRKKLNPKDPALRPLLTKKIDLTLIPPQGFTAFGLPVQSIHIATTDPDDEVSYGTVVAATDAMAEKAVKPYKKKAKGELMVILGDKPSLSNVVCDFSENYDQNFVD
ncbi:MAG: hypothetical protein LBE62_12230 [Azonexus sp.]|nr:hypothetical protein [Azonexus sp.]